MARYIDCDKCYHGRVCAYRHHYHDMITDCNHHIPTADVEEVKHGEWVWELQGIGKMNCKCTACQEWFPIKYEDLDEWGDASRETKRCPNCGAKMDGGKE